MTGIFKANNPYNNFLLLVYGLLLKLPMFLHPHIPQPQQLDGFLYKAFLQWMKPVAANIHIVYSIIAFGLLYIQALSLNSLVNSQRLMQKPNYLTGMSYLLFTSLFTDWYYLSSPLIINTLLIWVLLKLCDLHSNNSPKTSLFNIGMITGVATFFYFPSIAFAILIIVGLGITRPFKLPEWLMGLLGILTPYYFLAAWVFLTEGWHGYQFPGVSVTVPSFVQTRWAITAVIIVLFIVLMGIYFVQLNRRKQLVQARKSWNLIFLYLVVAVFVPFLNASKSFDYWILMAVPIAAIMGAAFLYPEKKWFAFCMHWSLVVISIVMGYYLK
ncbi:MAG: DUF6427 family protein [Ferruginibacter sp.]